MKKASDSGDYGGLGMNCRIRALMSWLLLAAALILSVLLGLGVFNPPHAVAAIRALEEAPGQWVYQSRQTLKDLSGNSWQTIAFKRVDAQGKTSIALRLVGFPGVAAIDHARSLTLTDVWGTTLTLPDASQAIFNEGQSLESNVAQYDLLPVLPRLQMASPQRLTLPIGNDETATLFVSPLLLQEWKTLADT